MKNFTIWNPITNEILRTGTCPDADFKSQTQEGESIVEGEFDAVTKYMDYVGDKKDLQPVAKGEKLGINYTWDAQNKTWAGDLPAAKAFIKLKIEDLRAQKDNAVIVYDNKNIDADQPAKDAIMRKIAELRSMDNTSAAITVRTWRDADNINHTWATTISYKLWLNRLLIAVSARSTDLRTAAWTRKDASTALTTVAAVEGYDYTTGW